MKKSEEEVAFRPSHLQGSEMTFYKTSVMATMSLLNDISNDSDLNLTFLYCDISQMVQFMTSPSRP